MDADVLVVGAGPAGLAVAACLRAARGRRAGGGPRDGGRRLLALPLRPAAPAHPPRAVRAARACASPGGTAGGWPRTTSPRYLRQYADHHGIAPAVRHGGAPPRTGRRRLEGARPDGAPLQTRQVVLATGYNREPVLPSWPGQDSFRGDRAARLRLHLRPSSTGASTCSSSAPGNTGAEIAADLAEGGAGAGAGSPCAPRRTSSPASSARSRRRCSASRWTTPPPGWPTRSTGLLQRRVRRRPDAVRAARPRAGRRRPDAGHRGDADHRRRPGRASCGPAGSPRWRRWTGSTATRPCSPTAPGSPPTP